MFETNSFLSSTREMFKDDIVDTTIKAENRATITVKPSALLHVAKYLFETLEFRFIIASALHTQLGFEIYYHFSKDETGLICNLHVVLPEKKPEVESLTALFEAANWIEREMHELFGIIFLNHPNLEALLSDGNWATGAYPYRKTPEELKK
jgi:NADH-quinone oxidoreductase subunit C